MARIQSAQNFLTSGSLLQVTLPSLPTGGNTLIMIVGSRNTPVAVNSISQYGATWVLARRSNNGSNLTTEIWYAQNLGGIVNSTVNINLAGTLHTGAVLVEYSGLYRFGALVDRVASSTGNSTAPDSGTTGSTNKEAELWIAGIANLRGDQSQSAPTSGFSLIRQVSTNPTGDVTHVVTGAYEKFVAAIGTAGTSVTIALAQQWAGAVATFVEEVFVTHNKVSDIGLYIADHWTRQSNLSASIAALQTRTATMEILKRGDSSVETNLSVLSLPPRHRISEMNVAIAGSNYPPGKTSDIDIYLSGTATRTVNLDIFKARLFTRKTNLGVHVGTGPLNPQVAKTKMNVAILWVSPALDNITTPEESQYSDCRPVWCAVPKQRVDFLDLNLIVSSAVIGPKAVMNMRIANGPVTANLSVNVV